MLAANNTIINGIKMKLTTLLSNSILEQNKQKPF